MDTKHRLLHSDKCCEGNVQAAMKEQNRSIVGWGQRPSEKVTVAMALRAEQRGENSIQRQQEVQAQGWVGGTGVGKTESRPVSTEPCVPGMRQQAGRGGGQCPGGQGSSLECLV